MVNIDRLSKSIQCIRQDVGILDGQMRCVSYYIVIVNIKGKITFSHCQA